MKLNQVDLLHKINPDNDIDLKIILLKYHISYDLKQSLELAYLSSSKIIKTSILLVLRLRPGMRKTIKSIQNYFLLC